MESRFSLLKSSIHTPSLNPKAISRWQLLTISVRHVLIESPRYPIVFKDRSCQPDPGAIKVENLLSYTDIGNPNTSI